MPKVVLTGGTGYIGSHVARLLLSEGWEVGIVSQPEFGYHNIEDILDRVVIHEYKEIDSLINFLQLFCPDVVMHLAAAIIKNPSPFQIRSLIRSNIEFGTEMLEAMKITGIKKFISAGTYWQNYNSDGYNPVDLYAATKEAFEKIIKYYTEVAEINSVILRLYDVFGEDDTRPKIWNILREKALRGETVDMSPGDQELYLVHVDDVALAFLKTYEWMVDYPLNKFRIFGVFNNEKDTLKNLVSKYEEKMGLKFLINWGANPYKEREILKPRTPYKRVPKWQCKPLIFNKLVGGNIFCRA